MRPLHRGACVGRAGVRDGVQKAIERTSLDHFERLDVVYGKVLNDSNPVDWIWKIALDGSEVFGEHWRKLEKRC